MPNENLHRWRIKRQPRSKLRPSSCCAKQKSVIWKFYRRRQSKRYPIQPNWPTISIASVKRSKIIYGKIVWWLAIGSNMRSGKNHKRKFYVHARYGNEPSTMTIGTLPFGWNISKWRWKTVRWIMHGIYSIGPWPFCRVSISFGTNTFTWKRCWRIWAAHVPYSNGLWSFFWIFFPFCFLLSCITHFFRFSHSFSC